MAVLEIDVHRYHIAVSCRILPHQTLASSSTSHQQQVRDQADLIDPRSIAPAGAEPKKKRKRNRSTAPTAPNGSTTSPPTARPRISEADLMSFHHSHAHLFSSPAAGPSKVARPKPRSISPSKILIPLSSPSRPSHITHAPAPLVPYSSSSQLQCSSSFDGALTAEEEDWQDALDEDEVDELATEPRPPVKRRKPKPVMENGRGMDTPTGAVKAAMKSKTGVGRLQELRGSSSGNVVDSPLKALKGSNTPMRLANGDAGAGGTEGTKKKPKKTKPVWQVSTPEAGYGRK